MPSRSDEDFRREIDSHIAIETDRLVAEGMSPDEARDAALRRFGNVGAAEERFYESRSVLWFDHLRQDVRYALRGLRQSPGFALVAIVTLAVGIGATTVVATQVNAVFFQIFPVGEPSALRTLAWSSPRRAFTQRLFRGPGFDTRRIDSFPQAVCRDIQRQTTSLAEVACWRIATEALMESRLVRVHAVSGTYFQTLRVNAVIGRTLTEDDDRPGAPLVALVRDPELLGQSIRLYGHLFSVVGVLPNDFTGLDPLAPADIIVPYAADHLFPTFQRNAWAESRIVVRLKDGVSADQARAETEVILHQLIRAEPPKESYDPPRLYFEELSTRLAEVQRNVTRPLQLLAATVAVLLVITCANIGGLLLARGRARHKELATRLALGGPRRRIVQQLVTESLVLCVAGATLGILVAFALTPLLPRLLNELGNTSAVGLVLRPNLGVLAFAIVVSGLCSALFGVLPAVAVTRVDPIQTLKQSSGLASPARLRGGKAALAVQLALSLVVIAGAGLLVRTMINLRAVPLGYSPEGLLFVETNNPVGRPRAVVEETLADLSALPGVRSAAVSQWPIFNNATPRFPICVPGADLTPQPLDYSFVFPGFFDTWGVRFVLGRDIDDTNAPQVVVNETFVRQYLANRNPLEASISFGTNGCPGRTQVPIVGVVADHIDRQRVERVPAVYARYPRAGALYVTTYAIRAAGDERALMPAMRRVIADRGIAPNRDVRRAIEYRDSVMRHERLLTRLLVFFGLVALFISCLGVYGMLAYTVTWRTPEIGLRIAVGARRADVVWMVVRESIPTVALGIAFGIAAAIALVQSVESFLFGVKGSDPLTLGAAATILFLATLLASWLPARRASRIEPLPALRYE